MESRGVKPILFNSLDETDVLACVASEHDGKITLIIGIFFSDLSLLLNLPLTDSVVVIHAASGFHTLSARALILGLAQRRKQTGKEVHYIHVRPLHIYF